LNKKQRTEWVSLSLAVVIVGQKERAHDVREMSTTIAMTTAPTTAVAAAAAAATAKKQQHPLQITPSTLVFPSVTNKVVTRTFTLTNTSELTVVFKIRTTVSKKYSVRPPAGQIYPSSKAEITGLCLAFVLPPKCASC
jgi:D-alanyl-D-alanine carboxypeptidase